MERLKDERKQAEVIENLGLDPNADKIIDLSDVHGIVITLGPPNEDGDRTGEIATDLREDKSVTTVNDSHQYNIAVEGIEAVILALACSPEFTDYMDTPEMRQVIETACDRLLNAYS